MITLNLEKLSGCSVREDIGESWKSAGGQCNNLGKDDGTLDQDGSSKRPGQLVHWRLNLTGICDGLAFWRMKESKGSGMMLWF